MLLYLSSFAQDISTGWQLAHSHILDGPIGLMVVDHTPGYGFVLHNLLIPFDRTLDDLLCLYHVLNLNRYHLYPINRDLLLILPCNVLYPLYRYHLLPLNRNHLHSLLWYTL